MCSSGGWYSFGKSRPNSSVLKGILIAGRENGSRGSKDATGISWRAPDGRIMLRKQAVDSPEFIKEIPEAQWEEIANSPAGLLHNRAKTKGAVENNDNNHPINAYGWVVVHNGTLHNEDDVFWYHKETKPCEVDTVAINMLLSKQPNYPTCFRELTVLSGGCTAAMWKVSDPDNLALIRLGPNELFLWEHDDILYWASTPLAATALPYRALASLVFQNTSRLPEDRLLVLSPGKARSFALTRSPFFYPGKPWASQGKSELPSSTPEVAGSSSPEKDSGQESSTGLEEATTSITHVGAKSYAWYGPGRVTLPGHTIPIVKPPPIHEELQNPAWQELYPIIKDTRNRHSDLPDGGHLPGKSTVRTGYGTWYFESQPFVLSDGGRSVIVKREFTPAKRQKPFLYAVFDTSFPKLPIVKKEDGSTPYDMILDLEKFEIKEKNPKGHSTCSFGYMCPVCGVVDKITAWTNNLMRCAFCNIRSVLRG